MTRKITSLINDVAKLSANGGCQITHYANPDTPTTVDIIRPDKGLVRASNATLRGALQELIEEFS